MPSGQTLVSRGLPHILLVLAVCVGLTVTFSVAFAFQEPENTHPKVDAGSDQAIILPGMASLDVTVTDDGLPNPSSPVKTSWSKFSGSGTVMFGKSSAVETTAAFSRSGIYVPRLTADDGSNFDLVVELLHTEKWAVISPPTMLSEVPAIQMLNSEGTFQMTVYANNQFLYPGESGFDEEIVKPLSAFYIKTSGPATVGFKFAKITGPRHTSRSLNAGWNLIGTNFPGPAHDELSQIQDTRTNAGMVILNVPNTENGNKNIGHEDWGSDGDRNFYANPITELPDRNLSVLDGYWVFLDGPKTYSKLLTETGETP